LSSSNFGQRTLFTRFGNLSSPSVLFALALEKEARPSQTEGIMVGFGPGLALEAVRFRLGGASSPAVM